MHAGSCLCGAVRFEVEGEFEHFYLCHCRHCQKDTGSAHAANLFSGSCVLSWLAGADKVTTYTLPGTRHTRNFCSVCGSALPSSQMQGKLLVVPAGSLDTALGMRPEAHLFVSSKADWDVDLDEVAQRETYP